MAGGRGGGTGAGRGKGTPNKRTQEFIDKVEAACREHDVDLIGGLVLLCKDDDPEMRLKARKELLPYVFPRLRSIEHTGDVDMAPTGFRLVVVREGDSVVTPGVDSSPEPVNGQAVDPLS